MNTINGYTLVGYNIERGERFPVFRTDGGEFKTYDPDLDDGTLCDCMDKDGQWFEE